MPGIDIASDPGIKLGLIIGAGVLFFAALPCLPLLLNLAVGLLQRVALFIVLVLLAIIKGGTRRAGWVLYGMGVSAKLGVRPVVWRLEDEAKWLRVYLSDRVYRDEFKSAWAFRRAWFSDEAEEAAESAEDRAHDGRDEAGAALGEYEWARATFNLPADDGFTYEEAKSRYKQLMKLYHSDLGEVETEEPAQNLNIAWAIIRKERNWR